MKLTVQETIQRLQEMAEENIKRREAFGGDGENPEYITLINALVHLG